MNRAAEYLAELLHDLRHALAAGLNTFRRFRALRRGACPDTVEF
ncbi:MAG: hypothetical protein RL456_624 [Pseudomonadota bacterium]|jgi:hypothetical protein